MSRRGRRRESWKIMRTLATRSALPWCMVGDFNDLMFQDEKRGGQRHPRNLLTGFTDVVNECDLVDLGFEGEKYTWEKSRGNPNWVQERLDRGLENRDWRDMFPTAFVQVMEVAPSDHLPLFLMLNRTVYVPKIQRFHFENMWVKNSECRNLVQHSWESVEGEELMTKIEFCRMKLEEWGGGETKKFKQSINHCRARLQKLRSRRDALGIQLYNEVRWEYLNLLEKQEVYWQQRAKQFWLREGDKNTKFFHSYASKRKKRNNLQRIKGEDGEWRETTEEVQGVIEGYFKKLFHSSTESGGLLQNEVVQRVTEAENEYLISDITLEEVKAAAFSMHLDKSPGIDGLNPSFFQTFWDVVGKDVFNFCREFMQTGTIPGAINRTVVCLIPKIKTPQAMTDLRHI